MHGKWLDERNGTEGETRKRESKIALQLTFSVVE